MFGLIEEIYGMIRRKISEVVFILDGYLRQYKLLSYKFFSFPQCDISSLVPADYMTSLNATYTAL